MSRLGCFSDEDRREQEQVLISKQIDPLGSDQELLVVERIVVGFPVDLRHVEIGWDSFFDCQAFKLRLSPAACAPVVRGLDQSNPNTFRIVDESSGPARDSLPDSWEQ